MEPLIKEVTWAYPTSDYAKKFGKYSEGCWCVKVGNQDKPLDAVASFSTRAEALNYAHTLDKIHWSYAFRKIYPVESSLN